MNCSNCGTAADTGTQLCLKCGTKLTDGAVQKPQGVQPPTLQKKKKMSVGCIIAIIVAGVCAIPVMAIIAAVLFPAISNARLQANAAALGQRVREVYIGIASANTEREVLGKVSAWPTTPVSGVTANQNQDPFSKGFTTSTDYFKAIADEEHYGTSAWKPLIPGFDYAVLAGAGVPPCTDHRLTAANNIWVIAANLTDAENDAIPLFITRNVDVKAIERVVNQGLTRNDFDTRIDLGTGAYKTPFGSRLGVIVKKNGALIRLRSRHPTLGALFGNNELPPRDPSKPKIVYLMP